MAPGGDGEAGGAQAERGQGGGGGVGIRAVKDQSQAGRGVGGDGGLLGGMEAWVEINPRPTPNNCGDIVCAVLTSD